MEEERSSVIYTDTDPIDEKTVTRVIAMIVVVEDETNQPPGSAPLSRSSQAQAQMATAKKMRAQRSITAVREKEGNGINLAIERKENKTRSDATTNLEERA